MRLPFCYIDVDLTLVDLNCKVYPQAVKELPRLMQKYTLVAWSAGGKDYAERVLRDNHIIKYFDYVLSKPSFLIDDDLEHIFRSARKVNIEGPSTWNNIWSLIFGKDIGA